ncbi:helix-turn-helix domain-containing protein [Streptomyces sp. NPDC059506]|uniref:helix-turn-helix domain-containing protein n=1 Tax=Streptomyces sp. NPDC059506 TaxID=3347751 RepID=UPI0036893CEE
MRTAEIRRMTGESPAGTTRAEDLQALVLLAGRRKAVRTVLDWLGRRTGGTVALVAGDGTVIAASPGRPGPEAVAAVEDLHRRGVPSGVAGGSGARTVHVVALGHGPYLALDGRDSHRHGTLLADAARVLDLCWRLEESERARRRTELVEAHSREAVLHLLMNGSVAAAHRIAGAMGPRLPNPARVCVVECPERRRSAIAERLTRTAAGRAWIVKCPVRPHHLIAIVPSGLGGLEVEIAEQVPECRIGVSGEVTLGETPLGYEQAFHTLATARGAPDRRARFRRHTDPAPLLGPEGARWAQHVLQPCLSYEPARRAGPGAEELIGTLGSWLSFGTAASRHLKVHRNTLAARLRLIEGLLGLDLTTSLADQSAAWLALRLRTHRPAHHRNPLPGPQDPQGPQRSGDPDRPAGLPALLAAPAARTWARTQVDPLGDAAGTVRAWLRADARVPATADSLGLSLPGVRKRLIRAEELLGRSLLHAPSAKYELWLAMRSLGEL